MMTHEAKCKFWRMSVSVAATCWLCNTVFSFKFGVSGNVIVDTEGGLIDEGFGPVCDKCVFIANRNNN
jgi:hypothetical protein